MRPDAVGPYLDALRAMDVEQKLRVAESLRSFAWEITRASIASRRPELDEAGVLSQVRAAFSLDRA